MLQSNQLQATKQYSHAENPPGRALVGHGGVGALRFEAHVSSLVTMVPGKSEVLRNRRAGGQREQGTGPGPAVPRGDGFFSELFALFYYFFENG